MGIRAGFKISIHVPREGDDFFKICISTAVHISIHVPREGDDRLRDDIASVAGHISIHVPREGDDVRSSRAAGVDTGFLSTSPARGTTSPQIRAKPRMLYFYPRPPRGGRRRWAWKPRRGW